MPRITVIGAGFGALTAIRMLRKADADIRVDVVAPKPEFPLPLFPPPSPTLLQMSQNKRNKQNYTVVVI